MEKLHFWKDGTYGTMHLARLTTKRTAVRTMCLMVLFFLIYHVFTAMELRKSISSVSEKAGGFISSNNNNDDIGKVIPTEKAQLPKTSNNKDSKPTTSKLKVTIGKENATLLMLVRNREMQKALGSMRMVEDRFNRNYHYPWTFMNDKPFTKDFINYTSGMASGPVEYIEIPKEHWSIPETLNQSLINSGMKKLKKEGVIYGGSLSYRHMCRFNSGFFYRQEALKKYDWYWRVEPDIEIYCDIPYDPFTRMRENNKVYGWVIAMYEFIQTIPTLFDSTKEFVEKNPEVLAEDNSLNWIIDNANVSQAFAEKKITGDYNLCHFWSNFEIANLNFFRGPTYQKYFDYLDSKGGFFYERWGDAPVHSLALALFLPRTKIHHFSDFGYNHNPAARCPQDDESHLSGRCYCERSRNFDLSSYSCAPRWFSLNGAGVGAPATPPVQVPDVKPAV
ncbi:nucleotide-diphospho-sugar transferase [Trichophaea hybrida]|nr:nucleotide-diphospho-sugar transferase [Trichophaea hybrida]